MRRFVLFTQNMPKNKEASSKAAMDLKKHVIPQCELALLWRGLLYKLSHLGINFLNCFFIILEVKWIRLSFPAVFPR